MLRVLFSHGQHVHVEPKGVLLWGKAYAWKISGTTREKVWAIVGDFVGVDKWVSSVVKSSELVCGEANKRGCVRHFICFPAANGEPYTDDTSQLLLMDESAHQYVYTILGGTIPGFSLMKNYVSSVALVSLPDEADAIVMHWSFTCEPSSSLTEQDAINDVVFPLYTTAMTDLRNHLGLPESAITLLS